MSINRIISTRISALLIKTPLRPNHVTTLALLFGLLAGLTMSRGSHAAMLWGALWLHIAFVLDNCDGEIARAKSLQTELGRKYDLVADTLVDLALWTGLGWGVWLVNQNPYWWAWALAACLGSVINQFQVANERLRGICTSVHSKSEVKLLRKKRLHLRVLDAFSHNGDSIWPMWIMALIGDVGLFLIAGCIYINIMWIWRLISHK
jgi:phosphatidylglycerophosphate synthase